MLVTIRRSPQKPAALPVRCIRRLNNRAPATAPDAACPWNCARLRRLRQGPNGCAHYQLLKAQTERNAPPERVEGITIRPKALWTTFSNSSRRIGFINMSPAPRSPASLAISGGQ